MFRPGRLRRWIGCAVWALVAASAAQGQSILARAEAKPSVVMVGESATYSIRFLNTSSVPNLNKPRVEGLDFNDVPSTSSFRQIINGQVSIETEMSWTFRPARVGEFTIPGRVVTVSGQEIRIPDVQVQAIPPDEEARSRALLVLNVEDPPWYVGQTLPARLSLLVRGDLNLSNIAFPEGEGDSFQHTEFDNNPLRGSTRLSGRLYNVVAWDILITPIKAGPAELHFNQDISLQMNAADERFPSIFSMSRSRTETYQVHTDRIETEILPLPTENQPDSFQDAIGSFSLSSELDSRNLQVGEPVTLILSLEGEGNFERISPPAIPEWENWRLYPPKVQFTPADDRGYEGVKTFEYILIPQAEDITEVPPIAYSTFNPETGEYVTTVLEARPVQVKPPVKPVDTTPLLPGEERSPAAGGVVPEDILPLRTNPGTLHPVDRVLWLRPLYWIGNLLVGLVLLALAAWLSRRNRLREDVHLARRHAGNRRIRKALQEAQKAFRDGEAGPFLQAARYILQERISHLSSKPVQAKTLVTSDCRAILTEKAVPDSLKNRIESILNAADAHQFAGATFDRSQLESLQNDLAKSIAELNRLMK